MGPLGSFLRLAPGRRALLCRSVLLLAGLRLGLATMPFAAMQGRGPRPRAGRQPDPAAIADVAWAVATAARLPWLSNCLAEALAAQALLARQGLPARLVLGVARAEATPLLAHAWLECDGQVVVGEAGRARYVPLPPLPERRA